MATFKFFNIGKANEEIVRLESELATAQAEAKANKENAEQVAKAAEENQTKLEQAEIALKTSRENAAASEDRAKKAEADLKIANDKLANPPTQIKEAASRQAQIITAGQGQPPVGATPQATGTGDILTQLAAIKDPVQKMAFYRKNRAAINAAHRAANPGDFSLGPKQD